MNKNIIKIVVGVLIVITLLISFSLIKSADTPFNQVKLSDNNSIKNNILPTYYDTVLSVAMDHMGISDQIVVVEKLSDDAKNQFDGELEAHVRYYNGIFYIFSEEFDRGKAIEVLSHEVIHIHQYVSNNLIYQDGYVIWLGETIELKSKDYAQRPWENDAFARQNELINWVEKILYFN